MKVVFSKIGQLFSCGRHHKKKLGGNFENIDFLLKLNDFIGGFVNNVAF